MPLYEYACGECGSHLEVRQRMTEDPLTTCPRCETDALERLVSRTSFALKGGGWYADGYGPPKTEAKTEGEAKADGDDTKKGGDEKGGDEKGDAKGESGKNESKSKSTEPAQDAKPKTTKSEPERAEPSPNPAANG